MLFKVAAPTRVNSQQSPRESPIRTGENGADNPKLLCYAPSMTNAWIYWFLGCNAVFSMLAGIAALFLLWLASLAPFAFETSVDVQSDWNHLILVCICPWFLALASIYGAFWLRPKTEQVRL